MTKAKIVTTKKLGLKAQNNDCACNSTDCACSLYYGDCARSLAY